MTRPDHQPPRTDPTPSWLVEPCPPWCVREHREDDHPEDRYHQSQASHLPVVAGSTDTIPMTDSLEAVDVVVRRGRHLGEVVEWLAIESDDLRSLRLLLTVESATALTSALADQLGIDEPP
ncbi:hypothetical protein [Nocardioides sp. W7]|uniref:DUF6907 domain-containing protein n=1 Tax=Nocardioides sp. W7 TaxID=2931390 RepID=UPI001FD4E9FC|nr:hypothetical protein [Nocardioides sp. W7]